MLYQHEICLFIILFTILFILCRHYTCLWPYLLHLWLWKLVSNVSLYSTTSACVCLLFINIIHTWKGLGTSSLGWVSVDLSNLYFQVRDLTLNGFSRASFGIKQSIKSVLLGFPGIIKILWRSIGIDHLYREKEVRKANKRSNWTSWIQRSLGYIRVSFPSLHFLSAGSEFFFLLKISTPLSNKKKWFLPFHFGVCRKYELSFEAIQSLCPF